MTLVLAVNGPQTNWMVVDTRLSFKSRPPEENGRKLMFLETTDAVAILGYAGLGQTAKGTQPSDWMSAVLRGRNFPLEQMLGTLADALKREFPPHLNALIPAHAIVVTAFCAGEVRTYTIDFVSAAGRKEIFLFTRHVRPPAQRPPRFTAAGSGAHDLIANRKWMRPILGTVRAHDQGRISAEAVADELAKINFEVHSRNKTVGPRCIVAWRHKPGGLHKGGGKHQFYDGTSRIGDTISIPIIAHGTDMQAVVGVMAPEMMRILEALSRGEPAPEMKSEELAAALSQLPRSPNERLE